MVEKRFWSNLVLLFLSALTCFTLWQVIVSSDTLLDLDEYSKPVYSLHQPNYSEHFYSNLLHLNDYNQLINLHFTFTTMNFACNDSSPLVLILIHSSPKNWAKRKTIRETWGKITSNKVKLLFILGSVKNLQLQTKLDQENELYNDFIQGSFLDTYRNITYKHVMLFKYFIYHCPEAKYVLKTDDDVFVNMPTMINFLNEDLSPYGVSNLLLCTPRKRSRVLRTYRSKWRVSFTEYPDKEYPPYCPGWFLLYSPDVIFQLYKQAQISNYFWIDDIHITGTLFKQIHKVHSSIESFVISKKDLRGVVDGTGNVSRSFLVGRPNLREKEIRSLWRYVVSKPIPKSLLHDVP